MQINSLIGPLPWSPQDPVLGVRTKSTDNNKSCRNNHESIAYDETQGPENEIGIFNDSQSYNRESTDPTARPLNSIRSSKKHKRRHSQIASSPSHPKHQSKDPFIRWENRSTPQITAFYIAIGLTLFNDGEQDVGYYRFLSKYGKSNPQLVLSTGG